MSPQPSTAIEQARDRIGIAYRRGFVTTEPTVMAGVHPDLWPTAQAARHDIELSGLEAQLRRARAPAREVEIDPEPGVARPETWPPDAVLRVREIVAGAAGAPAGRHFKVWYRAVSGCDVETCHFFPDADGGVFVDIGFHPLVAPEPFAGHVREMVRQAEMAGYAPLPPALAKDDVSPIIARIVDAGAELVLCGDRLILRTGSNSIPADLVALVRRHKMALMDLLIDAEERAAIVEHTAVPSRK